jgi:YesN/AraC family two-component response regulator
VEDEKSQAILKELSALEATYFYLSEDASLHNTAKLLNTNTSYLSKALNTVKKQSFSQYVNKLRIDYVLVRLKEDAVFRSYTIHAISKEIGYKSATTFIKEFKNKTGLNPSYYIKKIDS